MPVQTNCHTGNNNSNTYYSSDCDMYIFSVNKETKSNGNYDKQNRNHSSRSICGAGCNINCTISSIGSLKSVCNDRSKCSYNKNKCQVSKC